MSSRADRAVRRTSTGQGSTGSDGPRPPRDGSRALITASLVATVGVVPLFLVGPLAFLMRADIDVTQSQLGLVVGVGFAAAAVGAVPSGRLAERLTGRSALAVAAVGSGVVLVGLALTSSFAVLVGWMIAAGMANSFSQLAANLRVSGAVATDRQGLAFGVKQSAIPAATLAAGAAVPAIALTVGWRWVFVAAAVVAFGLAATQVGGSGRSERRQPGHPRGTLAYPPLVVLAAAVAFGAAAATAMATFVVDYGVAAGVAADQAGMVLALGSVAAVTMRVALGWLADRRRGGNLSIVTAMLVVGALAVAAFPAATTASTLLAVTLVAYAVGWGWPGLFNFTIVRRNPQAPAAATGVTQVGVYVGGVAGPLTFGVVAERAGYPTAWWTAAGWLLVAAALMLFGRALARRAWLPRAGTSSTGPSTGAR